MINLSFIFLLLSALSGSDCFSGLPGNSNAPADSLAIRGFNHIFNLDFSSADSCVRALRHRQTEQPLGDYLELVSDFYRIISGAEPDRDDTEFIAKHDRFLERLESSRSSLSDDDYSFFQGCIYGSLARYRGSQGDWLKAFYHARKAKRSHESVTDQSAYYYDAQLTPGVYHYYAATLPKWIRSLASVAGLGGDKDLGIRQLSSAAAKGTIHNSEALFMLVQILMNEGKYEQALEISKKMMPRYPDNPYLVYQTGQILFLMEDYESAEPFLAKASNRSVNRYAPCEQIARYHLGRIAVFRNRYAEAYDHFMRVFQLEPLTEALVTTHGWISGSACFYAGVAAEHLGKSSLAAELYQKGAAHEHSVSLIKQNCKFRIRYPMNSRHLAMEDMIHHTIMNKDEPDSLMYEKHIRSADEAAQPGLTAKLDFAFGKRHLLNQRFEKAAPFFLSAAESAEDFPDRLWIRAHSYYYLACCEAAENNFQKIREYLQTAKNMSGYPGEERMRFLYDEMLEAIFQK